MTIWNHAENKSAAHLEESCLQWRGVANVGVMSMKMSANGGEKCNQSVMAYIQCVSIPENVSMKKWLKLSVSIVWNIKWYE